MGSSLELLDHPDAFDLTSDAGFILALNEVKRLRPGGLCIVALCCESFSAMCLGSILVLAWYWSWSLPARFWGLVGFAGLCLRSRATSGRSIVFPLGHKAYAFVQRGNLLLCRVVLLLMLCSYKKARFLLEQPAGS